MDENQQIFFSLCLFMLLIAGITFYSCVNQHDENLRTAGFTQCFDAGQGSGHIWTYKTLNCGAIVAGVKVAGVK